MKRMLMLMLITIACLSLAGTAMAVDIEQVRARIKATGANWTAGETSVSNLSPEEMQQYCNLNIEIPENWYDMTFDLPIPEDMPAHLDWRDIDGQDFTTPIKDQHPCGTCATFSSIGAFEALFKIAVDNPFIVPDFSEQHVYSCEGFMPYTFFHPMAYLKNDGAPDETCYPYHCENFGDRPPCSESCDDWSNRAFKTKSYRMMMWPSSEQIKAALQDGPIVAGFQVRDDFFTYTGGVYENTGGMIQGGHGIAIVGYDDEGEYWICKNSWGTEWGEEGWFRYKWESGFLAFGYQSMDIEVDIELLCGNNLSPSINSLYMDTAKGEIEPGEDLTITFAYESFEADLAGAELWYAVDGGEFQRYEEPLVDFVDTVSAPEKQPYLTLPGVTEGGSHTLSIYVKDLCGNASNELEVDFDVAGADDDDDDTVDDDTNDDDDNDDNDDAADDDDDDDNDDGCGC